MAKNYMFLLLPEYPDEENVTTAEVFQHQELPDVEAVDAWLKQLVAFLDFFKEEACSLVYDAQNLKSCLYVLDTLRGSYPNRSLELLSALSPYADWRRARVSDSAQEYEIYHTRVRDEVRTEIAERHFSGSQDECLVVVHIPHFMSKTWEVTKAAQTVRVDSVPMDIRDAFEWLVEHRCPMRIYNWNPKHGEHGVGAHPANKGDKVSLLLCSKEHAEQLLQRALGTQGWDCLWTYDADHQRFMEFPAETKATQLPQDVAQRQYHSYHIENSEGIPKEVLRRLGLIGALPQ